MIPPTLPDLRTTPVPPEWQGRQDPIAAVGHSVPHRVVPQLLRPVLAAPLPPSSIHIRTLRDAACCVTSIRYCYNDHSDEAARAIPDLLVTLLPLTNLKSLELFAFSTAGPFDFAAIANFKQLTSLGLRSCSRVNADVLRWVGQLPSLTVLDLTDCSEIATEALIPLVSLPLRELMVGGILSGGLYILSRITTLTSLSAPGSRDVNASTVHDARSPKA